MPGQPPIAAALAARGDLLVGALAVEEPARDDLAASSRSRPASSTDTSRGSSPVAASRCAGRLVQRAPSRNAVGSTASVVSSSSAPSRSADRARPGTGPCTCSALRPAAESVTCSSSADSGSPRRGRRASDPTPRPCPTSAPERSPSSRASRRIGPQRQGGRLQVVAHVLGERDARRPRAARAARRGRPRASPDAARCPGRGRRGAQRRRAGRRPPGSTAPRSSNTLITQSKRPFARAGLSWSPRPVPTAVPPISANGTSAPSREARRCSSAWPTSVPHSASHATRAAAASADPPPMPPATGTFLRMSRCTPPS